MNYLGQLRHENLVKLIGYCSESDNRLLVYEFMPRGSLENHLFRSEYEYPFPLCISNFQLFMLFLLTNLQVSVLLGNRTYR